MTTSRRAPPNARAVNAAEAQRNTRVEFFDPCRRDPEHSGKVSVQQSRSNPAERLGKAPPENHALRPLESTQFSDHTDKLDDRGSGAAFFGPMLQQMELASLCNRVRSSHCFDGDNSRQRGLVGIREWQISVWRNSARPAIVPVLTEQ